MDQGPGTDGNVDWKDFFDVVDRYGIEAGMLIEVRGLDDFEKSMRYLTQRGFVHER